MEITNHPVNSPQPDTSAIDQLVETLAASTASDESLRIYLGRRIVLGELASGENRQELSEDRAEMILAALDEPAIAGTAALDKVPAIEIRQGHEILFRQERDGGISINAFQSELTPAAAIPETIADPWLAEPPNLETIAQVAQTLIDPLGDSAPLTDAMLGDIHLHQTDTTLTLLQDSTPLLTAAAGQVETPEAVSPEATATLQGWVKEHVWIWQEQPVVEVAPESGAMAASRDSSVNGTSQAVASMARFSEQALGAIAIAQQQFQAIPESNTRQFFQTLAADLSSQAMRSVEHLRQGLKQPEFQALPQRLSTMAQDGMTRTAASLGHSLEKSGNWIASSSEALKEQIDTFGHRLEHAGQWLASRPSALQEQRMARATLEIFDRGFARTQESAYEHQGFKVESQGRDRFTLSDARTQTALLQFEVERADAGDGSPRVMVTNRGDVSLEQQRALAQPLQQRIASMRHHPEPVLGSAEAEQRHAEQSQQIGFLAKSLAEALGTDDYQGRHYRVQVREDSLSITANDGRGEVFWQSGDQFDSKLEQRDFQRFAQITQAMTVGESAIAEMP